MAVSITNFNQMAYEQQMYLRDQHSSRGWGCGCFPPPPPPPYWNERGNLPNANVGRDNWWCGGNDTKGFAVDINRNGRYDRGQDGVLAMDLNRDGIVSRQEIEASRQRLMAFQGNYDFNNDGRVDWSESFRGQHYSRQMEKYDQDGDGQLSPREFAQAGGRVLVDRNQDGRFQPWEQHSPFNFPMPGFGNGRLGDISPWGTEVHRRRDYHPRPWGPPIGHYHQH
jgi:hypothetical protein